MSIFREIVKIIDWDAIKKVEILNNENYMSIVSIVDDHYAISHDSGQFVFSQKIGPTWKELTTCNEEALIHYMALERMMPFTKFDYSEE